MGLGNRREFAKDCYTVLVAGDKPKFREQLPSTSVPYDLSGLSGELLLRGNYLSNTASGSFSGKVTRNVEPRPN